MANCTLHVLILTSREWKQHQARTRVAATGCCAVAVLTWFSEKAKTMNNRVGGWGCALTKLSGGGVPGNSPRMRRGRRFSEFAERKALPKAPPFSTARHSRGSKIAILRSLPGEGGTPDLLLRTPLAPPLLSTRFFLFSAAGPAVCCSCRLISGPLLAADCCLETTASHSTTPSGFLGTQE